MGKGSGPKKTYVSKGLNSNVSKKTLKSMKKARTYLDKVMYALKAYTKGKRVKKYGFEDLPEARFNKYQMKNT